MISSVALPTPGGWRLVPPPGSDSERWVASTIADVSESSRERLTADLNRIVSVAASDPRVTRTRAVFISAQADSQVSAFLTIDYYAAGDDAYAEYWSKVSASLEGASTTVGSQVFTGRAIEHELAGSPAVVVHDFLSAATSTGGTALQERYLAAIFPEDGGIMIEVQITTADLNLFGNIVDYGDSIANTITWKAE